MNKLPHIRTVFISKLQITRCCRPEDKLVQANIKHGTFMHKANVQWRAAGAARIQSHDKIVLNQH